MSSLHRPEPFTLHQVLCDVGASPKLDEDGWLYVRGLAKIALALDCCRDRGLESVSLLLGLFPGKGDPYVPVSCTARPEDLVRVLRRTAASGIMAEDLEREPRLYVRVSEYSGSLSAFISNG